MYIDYQFISWNTVKINGSLVAIFNCFPQVYKTIGKFGFCPAQIL